MIRLKANSEFRQITLNQMLDVLDGHWKDMHKQNYLVSDNAFNKFDLIVCRNVLIYFNKSLQDNVLEMFYNSLTESGILAIGSKETLMLSPIDSKMQVVNDRWKIWKKKE